MVKLSFDIDRVGYEALQPWSDMRLPAMLAAGAAPVAGYPLLARPPLSGEGTATNRSAELPTSGSPALDRSRAAATIAACNPDLPAPPPEADYVIAGQQAGLLTGPLYTFLKAISAIGLAHDLGRRLGRTILPLFWIAGEDHDVLEVNRVILNDRRFVVDFEGEIVRGEMPQVADIDLRSAREPLLRFVEETLPETEFRPWILEQVAAADWANYVSAFRDLMQGLFREWGLRTVDPIALRPLTAPVLAAVVARWPDATTALEQGAATLRAAGLEPPLQALGLFEIDRGRRVPVEADASGMCIGGRHRAWEAAAAFVRDHPERFSAGAALRPIGQDGALPVVATVGGPSELAYLWQIEPVAQVAQVRSSARYPRISATFLTPAVSRLLKKADLRPAQIFTVERMLTAADRTDAHDPRAEEIRKRGEALLETIDDTQIPGNPRWLRKSRDAIAGGVARIVQQLEEARAQEAGRGRERLQRIAAAVTPDGKAQERVINVYELLNLHGPQFVAAAVAQLDPWVLEHQIATVKVDAR